MRARHQAQDQEDLEYLLEGTCPYTKQPCEQMKKGRLVLNRKKLQGGGLTRQ